MGKKPMTATMIDGEIYKYFKSKTVLKRIKRSNKCMDKFMEPILKHIAEMLRNS